MAEIIFHLPRSWLGPFGSGVLPFYARLGEGLRDAGVSFEWRVLERAQLGHDIARDKCVHIINHGRIQHERAWNAGIAYVYPFWNMDRTGIRAFSSIAQARFDPRTIEADQARPFFRKLRQRLAVARVSRYEQPLAHQVPPEGCVAIFLQSEAHRVVGETCFLDRWAMVEGVLHATDTPVVIKPHPRDTDPQTHTRLRQICAEFPNALAFEGNIHDLLAACARVVTINSAVGIEAYLHRKPVILCGRSDFHHIADVAQDEDTLAAILGQQPRKRAYDKFIWWYFAHHCLSTSAPDLTERFLDRVGLA